MTWNRNQKIKYSYEILWTGNIPKRIKTGKSWNSSVYKKIKKYIKDHYSIFQEDKCAYCRMPINFAGYGEPVEHIVPKDDRPKWMFHPKNLCLSCYGCNTKKSTKWTMSKASGDYGIYFKDIPLNGSEYKIVHPHYDKYSKHILIDKLLAKPNKGSIKGVETIKVCKLNRLDLIHKRVLYNKYAKKDLRHFYMQKLIDPATTLEEKKAIKNYIKEIIRRYKYKIEVSNKFRGLT